MVLTKILNRSGYRLLLSRCASSCHVTPDGIIHSPAPTLDLEQGNFASHILDKVKLWKDATAMKCGVTGRETTYSQVLDESLRWSGFLKKIGMGQGSVVSIIADNCLEFTPIFLGTIAQGAVLSPINSRLTKDEIKKLLERSGATLLITAKECENIVKDIVDSTKSDIRVMCLETSKYNWPNVTQIFSDKNIQFSEPIELSGSETMFLPFSSGTTGNPKAVAISHNAFLANLQQYRNPYHNINPLTLADGYENKFMAMLPFFHIYGAFIILSVGLSIGAKTVTLPKFDPEQLLSIIINDKITMLHTVPTVLHFMNSRPEVNKENMGSIDTILCGAAPVSPSSAKVLTEKLDHENLQFLEGYGMTELMITNMTPRNSNRIGTSGLLLSNMQAKIIDTSTGKILGPNEEGEICIKSPSAMNGYLNNPEATVDMIREGFVHTGDVGYYDQEGYFYIVDRTKDLIKVKGLQVSPSEIEEAIQTHPSVIECSVIGIPHDRLGEAPKAFVIIKDKVSAEELLQHVHPKLSKHKHLVGGITFVDALPKTETGKVLRRKLRNLDK